ncbi:hypothetical protein [Streptomyces vietnamensis]|uniref:Uncharacterized protein n=1 Tax=Streptomyces vietnamensis TaxID=362257 RepID=A0A0B5I8G3_9ACTN|nr:hypothetical protein [Streptomyces vietnamensis]AJF70310.1 hypothetical protein SVTN_39465 [Streptomyces vietnamensis]
MPASTNAPRPDRDNQELRLVVLLLALALGLLVTSAVVYVALVHPSTAEPLAVGAGVLGALTGAGGLIARVLRHWR